MLVFYTDIQCVTQALTVRESEPSSELSGVPDAPRVIRHSFHQAKASLSWKCVTNTNER